MMSAKPSESSTAPGGVSLDLPQPLTVRVKAAVKLTGIGRSKLYELIKSGEIETVKVGSARLIIMDSLRRLVDSRRS